MSPKVKHERTWEESYKELAKFHRRKGHVRVPYVKKHNRLARWLSVQKNRRNGRYHSCSQLSQEQRSKLEALGVWVDEDSRSRVAQEAPAAALKASQPEKQSNKTIVASPSSACDTSSDPISLTGKDAGVLCKVLKIDGHEIGFVMLPSSANTTYAQAREIIMAEGLLQGKTDWSFHIPRFGAITTLQEVSLGPLWNFLKQRDPQGSFSADGDLQVYIAKAEPIEL